jgi:prepilin-type N-terminal cleavage/methylation domain-containing protein/prepilin-type processing-associated H-X9-DG protein
MQREMRHNPLCRGGSQPDQRRRARSAFTLIELLVVVSIMAILMSILLPSLKKAKSTARETICKTNLRSIHLAQSLLLEVRSEFQSLNNEPNDGKWQYNYIIYDGNNWKNNFGPLITDKRLLHDVKLLYCPFQKDTFHSQNTSDNPFPPNTGFDTRSSYARRHLLTGKPLSRFRRNIAIFSDVIHMPKVVRSAHKKGVNAVFLDGHATWVSDPGIFTDNELGEPFDELDNPIIDLIWRAMDARS